MTAAIGKRLKALETFRNSEPYGGLVVVLDGESVSDALTRCNISGGGRGVVVVPAKATTAICQRLHGGEAEPR